MILDEILKQKTKDLKLFTQKQIDELQEYIVEKNDKVFVNCLVRQKEIQISSKVKTAPEEVVRQLYLLKLRDEYGYPFENMALEVDVTMGSSSKKADIV